MRAYFNEVTRSNVELSKSLKADIAAAHVKATDNARIMANVAAENARLGEPLDKATSELARLRAIVRNAARNRDRLQQARLQLHTLNEGTAYARRETEELVATLARVNAEREALRERFEASIDAATRYAAGTVDTVTATSLQRSTGVATNVSGHGDKIGVLREVTGAASPSEEAAAAKDVLMRSLRRGVAALEEANLEAAARVLGEHLVNA